MSTVLSRPDIETEVVDSVPTLLSLLDNFTNLPTYPPALYLDLEGIRLGRHGSISIVSLYIVPRNKIYLVDVYRLGETAFSTSNSRSSSLKTVLESQTIPKVVFDIRNDSDALFSHYQISVDGIKDLQLMELATRQGPKDFVAGLAKCVEKDSSSSALVKAGWQRTKNDGGQLYDPQKGGRYEVFNERPMKPEIVKYCAQDVALLPELYKVYNSKLCPPGQAFWRFQVQQATIDRIKLSQSPDYDGQAKSKVQGPWDKSYIQEATERWNDDVLENAMADQEEEDDFDWQDDTARDCIGWEEDMVKNGEYY
jgi:exonuclease 3'-5' domain-containing protein 1